jgi:hypothetical protein
MAFACDVGINNNIYKRQTICRFVGFEVSTAVVMKSINFWDITPCSPLLATCLLAGFLLKLFLRP